jgi:hypothetical protein
MHIMQPLLFAVEITSYAMVKIYTAPMPTILRQTGFRVVIYLDDHLPAHVHVINANSEVKIDLGDAINPPQIIESRGQRRDAAKALELVTINQAQLLEAWRQIHGKS